MFDGKSGEEKKPLIGKGSLMFDPKNAGVGTWIALDDGPVGEALRPVVSFGVSKLTGVPSQFVDEGMATARAAYHDKPIEETSFSANLLKGVQSGFESAGKNAEEPEMRSRPQAQGTTPQL